MEAKRLFCAAMNVRATFVSVAIPNNFAITKEKYEIR